VRLPAHVHCASLIARFLQSESFYAVAQKKYVFVYDQNGVELQYVRVCS